MILITGATGTNGSELVKQLSNDGVRVRALVRSRAKASAIEGANVEIVEGDLGKPETLDAALAGVEKVFLLTSPTERMAEQEGNMIEAAKRAGVGHVVKFSAIGADVNAPYLLGRMHGEVEKQLADSGIAYTLLKPNGFMQNTLGFASTIASQGAFYAPLKDAKVSYVDARDIVAVAAKTLTGTGHEGKAYEITGPEALSNHDIAEKLSVALDTKVAYVDVPPDAARQGMLAVGMSEWLADALIELFAFYTGGHAAMVTNTVSEVAKKEPTTFDQFARDHAHIFRATRREAHQS